MDKFELEIINLINLNQEGSYWDFKRQWYTSEKIQDLLHDIICMANNLSNRDAYIIIGVNDDFSFNDVRNDPNRKNTQNIVDFLKDKDFAGDIRPTVLVKSICIQKVCLDVIVIKNTNYTPFYLKTNYRGVNANNIYLRIQDTNTPLNKSADIDKVEYLWKKRFGLTQTPLEKLEIYLEDYKNWIDGPNGEMDKYYKFFPEYTLHYEFDDSRTGYEYYVFFQMDNTPKFVSMKLFYHQTLLKEFVGACLDGGRYVTPCPNTDGIVFEGNHNWDIMYKYIVKDSFLYVFHNFIYLNELSSEAEYAHQKFLESILVFENEDERLSFKYYVKKNWEEDKMKYQDKIHTPYVPDELGKGYKKGAFKEECTNIMILQKMLIDFRKISGKN